MFAGINTHRKHENVVWTNVTSSIINNKKMLQELWERKQNPNESGGRCAFWFSHSSCSVPTSITSFPAVTNLAICLFPHYCITKHHAHLPGKDNISHIWGLPLISVVELEVRGLPSPGPYFKWFLSFTEKPNVRRVKAGKIKAVI